LSVIHTPLEEHRKNVFEGAVPPEYTHDMEVTLDASNCFQLYTACNQFTVNARQVIIKIIQNKTQ